MYYNATAFMQSTILLNAVILSVIMLSVVAPLILDAILCIAQQGSAVCARRRLFLQNVKVGYKYTNQNACHCKKMFEKMPERVRILTLPWLPRVTCHIKKQSWGLYYKTFYGSNCCQIIIS
jgi:hypothetical protein